MTAASRSPGGNPQFASLVYLREPPFIAAVTRRDVSPCALHDILEMREHYRRAMGVQIVHDSWHERGFTQSYLFLADGRPVGYGSVGGAPRESRDVVKEFFIDEMERESAPLYFRTLVATSGAKWVETQTNDHFLSPMLDEFGRDASSETVLFADAGATAHKPPDVRFRPLAESEHASVFAHTHESIGEWALERQGEVVATGGFTLYYNFPFADLYMEVSAPHQGKGLGRFLVQELKRECYAAERVPAARCHESNGASQATLIAAGMVPCGRIVRAKLSYP